jgi:hypothetical protein
MRDRDPDQLLAAYVDGVSELTPEERRSVEARLADPTVRAEETATRSMIDQLRGLGHEPAANEPDWAAMERAIADEVGPDVPRPWWRARIWRWMMPALGAVAATAIILLLVTRPESAPEPGVHTPDVKPVLADVKTPVAPVADDSISLYLDGMAVEVSAGAEDLLGPDELDDDTVTSGFLPTADLAWIDSLDEESIQLAESALARKKG